MMMQQRKYSRKRKRKTTVVKPIVIGNISFYRQKKVEGKEDYAWCCYVRNAEKDKDGKIQPLHQFVRKVVFTLHESFDNNVIEIEKPPFSIVRNGWGEFDVNITIHFQDNSEEPVTKIHGIRIFHLHQNQKATIKKPVVNENYDEIVFNEPTEFFYHMLTDDPEETFKSQFINPFPGQIDKAEESKEAEAKPKEIDPTTDKDMDADKPAEDVEMKPEDSTEKKDDGEENIGEEENKETGDFIVENSTYEVKVGANDEHIIDVTQFFEDHNDKADIKFLTDCLKSLREETMYLRKETEECEKTISDKKEKLRQYDQ
ncbi:unnamed protein product [Moneuplotes crassus]|uniref:YEATS domain-containing protein n=1 Tax=Euplotes crassus TaxID=5936 RepID=A0AAD1XM75_EUPCR|nr:unnamed protein product [Moneuplotes crassus]